MSITVAKNSVDWDKHTVLPVRNGQGAYLGTLSRSALRAALPRQHPGLSTTVGDSVLAHLSAAMITSATGLLSLSEAYSPVPVTPPDVKDAQMVTGETSE